MQKENNTNISDIYKEPKRASSFLSDVLKLAGGTTIAQTIVILIAPIITRLYGPADFGLSALFGSIVGILSIIACMRYEMAIMLPREDRDAANLLALSILCAIFFSILTIPFIWLAKQPLLELLKAPGLAPYLWFVPISVFFSGVFSALNYWNSRTKRFGRLSIARVVSSTASAGTQLGAGFRGYASGGSLIIAGIIGSVISAILLGGQIGRDDGQLLKKSINLQDMIIGLKRYKRFPIFDSWSTLLNTTSWQLPTFLLSAFFSSTVVGYFALGMIVLQLPSSLIGGAISQVFFQRAAEAKFDNMLPQIVETTFVRLAMIAALPLAILSLTGKEIFIVIFGTSWAEAGIYAQILAPWIFLVFITTTFGTLFSILEKQDSLLIFNIILFGTRGGALILGGLSGDARIAIILFAAVGVIDYIGLGLWVFIIVGIQISKLLNHFIQLISYCALTLGLIALSKWVLLLAPQIIVLLDIFMAAFYYFLFLKREDVLNQIYKTYRS